MIAYVPTVAEVVARAFALQVKLVAAPVPELLTVIESPLFCVKVFMVASALNKSPTPFLTTVPVDESAVGDQ